MVKFQGKEEELFKAWIISSIQEQLVLKNIHKEKESALIILTISNPLTEEIITLCHQVAATSIRTHELELILYLTRVPQEVHKMEVSFWKIHSPQEWKLDSPQVQALLRTMVWIHLLDPAHKTTILTWAASEVPSKLLTTQDQEWAEVLKETFQIIMDNMMTRDLLRKTSMLKELVFKETLKIMTPRADTKIRGIQHKIDTKWGLIRTEIKISRLLLLADSWALISLHLINRKVTLVIMGKPDNLDPDQDRDKRTQ